jgi:hypothetical protein
VGQGPFRLLSQRLAYGGQLRTPGATEGIVAPSRTWEGAMARRLLERLSAGMSPDLVDFTASAIYVLEERTVPVFSLPSLVRTKTFGSSGRGTGRLEPTHTVDQAIRAAGRAILAEDNDMVIIFSPG